MSNPETHNEYSLFSSNQIQPNQNPDRPFSNVSNQLDHSNNRKMYQNPRDGFNYESKYSHENRYNNNYRNGNLINFDFNQHKNETQDQRVNSERKNKTVSYYNNNFTLFEKIKESNLHYVGFENKNGENTCYINVVLHWLYIFPSINEFLIKLYKDNQANINLNNSDYDNKDMFLFYLGKTLFEYQTILADANKREITILHTTELRKYLQLISKNFYSLNKVGDPVELLTFLLNEINNKNKLEVHEDFFINLIEEIKCNDYCKMKDINKYDENNFIHHIYVNEILHYINQKQLNFDQYNHRLFSFCKQNSYNYMKRCKNCQNNGNTLLKILGPNYPTFFLLNCVWNIPRPELKDVIKFLYLLSLEDTLHNLFHFEDNKINFTYNLLGLVFYSGGLSHYVTARFNIEKNIFVLYNDDKIKELASIHEVYKELTAEQIKNNPNAFYYPVLLIYNKEILYNDPNTMKLNDYSYSKYKYLDDTCEKVKNSHIPLTEEQKRRNIEELIYAQIRYNRTMSEDQRNKQSKQSDMNIEEETTRKSADINNNLNIYKKNADNMIVEEEKIFQFDGDEEKEKEKEKEEEKEKEKEKEEEKGKLRINKRYGTDYKRNNNFHFPNKDFFPSII